MKFIVVVSQDIHFSQFYMAPMIINPGLAGAEFDTRAVLQYRDQWRSVSTPYTTFQGSYDMRFKTSSSQKGFFGAGVVLLGDVAGDSKMGTTLANLSGSYHVYLQKNMTLGVGVQGGAFQRSFDETSLKWGNQYESGQYNGSVLSNETLSDNGNRFVKSDLSAGITFNYQKGNSTISSGDHFNVAAGVAFKHINNPSYTYSIIQSDDRLYRKLVSHVNIEYGIVNTNIILNPALLYMSQGPSQDVFGGLNVTYKLQDESKVTGLKKASSVTVGGFYRNKDAFVTTFMVQYSKYSFGASYDINSSPLTKISRGRGAIEFFFRYVTPSPFKSGSSSGKSRFD